MARTSAPTILQHLRRMAGASGADALTDAHLVGRWLARRDEAAFELLVWRHGPMVLDLCRRVLRHEHDVEDAFQATFLVLVRKAASIGKADSVGSWLYKVAYRVALEVKATAARALPVEDRPAPADEEMLWHDLRPVLDDEVNRLPEKYRAPFVLCYLQGKTNEEAARELRCPKGTVCSRLAWARRRLRARLTRRGLAPSAALSGALLAQAARAAALPPGLAVATRQAAVSFAAGTLSARTSVLAEAVLVTSGATPLRAGVIFMTAVGLVAVIAGLAAHRMWPEKPTEEPKAALKSGEQPQQGPRLVRTDIYGDPLPPGVLARMGTVRLRHASTHLVFAPDGKAFLTCGTDGTLRHWDVATGKPLRCVRLLRSDRDKEFLIDPTLTPDGKVLVAYENERAYLYDTATGKELLRLAAGPARHAASFLFAADGRTLAWTTQAKGDAETTRLCDLATGKERFTLEHARSLTGLAMSPDGKRLVSLAEDDLLCLWDVATGKALCQGKAPAGRLAFAPDGKTVASSGGGTVVLWEASSLKEQARFGPPAKDVPSVLAFSPDGAVLAVAGREGIDLWDVAAHKPLRRLPDSWVAGVAFAPDGKTLASWGYGAEIRLWDVATGKSLQYRPGHGSTVASLAVSPDGKVVVSGSYGDFTMHLWDAATGRPLHRLTGHASTVRACAFSADGRWVVSGGRLGTLHLWDTATGKELRRFATGGLRDGAGIEPYLRTVCLSPDGKHLAAVWLHLLKAGQSRVVVWEVVTGKLLTDRPCKVLMHSRRIDGSWANKFEEHACFTPDGKGLTVRTDEGLLIEEATTGRGLAKVPLSLGRPLTFSADGLLVAAALLRPHQDPYDGYKMEGICLAETVTGAEVLRIDTGPVDYLDLSPDGRLLATADAAALRLWDAATGKLLFRRPWPASVADRQGVVPCASLALLPGGRAATGMADGTVLVWDLQPQTWPAAAAKDLGRGELDRLWADLAGGDARAAHRAIHALAAAPAQAVPMLKDRLRPAAAVEPRRLQQLLADLDSDRFAVREAAAQELTQLGEQVETALRQVLQYRPSAEVRKRVQGLLEAVPALPPGAALRALRAIHIVECIGTPAARCVLENLATGDAAARQTRAAKEALQRLDRRPWG
jgi:RNA polymerase sigma factor (sigma-70 family)